MSEMQLTKRRLLSGIAIASAAVALVACNDSKDAADASSSGKTMADGTNVDIAVGLRHFGRRGSCRLHGVDIGA
ncbi:hypothetical protein AB9F35_34855, partial [Rhizobium leguminosarum]